MKAWIIVAGLVCVPNFAIAQTEVALADSHSPRPAERHAVGELALASGALPQVAGSAPSSEGAPETQRTLRLEDVQVVYAPSPSKYQPEGNGELADQGRPFDIACTVGADGRMQDCAVGANTLRDQAVAEKALGDVQQFIVGPETSDGGKSAGQVLVVTCRFEPLEPEASLAALDTNVRP